MARPVESLPRPTGDPPDRRAELWRLYDVAVREYHLNTTLGTQRQAFYIGLNVTLVGVLASFKSAHDMLLLLAYLVGAAASLLGVAVVAKSHEYYRNARRHLQKVEAQLGLDRDELALSTTAGMVGATGKNSLKVTGAAKFVLVLLATFDVASAGWIVWRLLS